jgi:hypothetical protein
VADPFGVDPGPPPSTATADDAAELEAGDDVVRGPGLALEPGPDLGRVEDGVRGFYRFAFGILHYTVGRDGPPDAFQPTDGELEQMVRPAAQVVARSQRAASVAQRGDVIGALGSTGAYLIAEIERVERWKRKAADARADATADAAAEAGEAGDFGVPASNLASSARRPWRPRRDYGEAAG